MQFTDPIASGNILVREALQSQNWDAGIDPRWRIAADGTASFSGAVTAGSFSTGDPPPKVVIEPQSQLALVKFFTGSVDEANYGAVYADGSTTPERPSINIGSPETIVGASAISITAPASDGTANGNFFVSADPFETGGVAEFFLDTAVVMRISQGHDVSLGSTNEPFRVGDSGGTNIAMDTNEIMARNNGAIAPLILNQDGGNVTIGGGLGGTGAMLAGNMVTGTFVAAATPGGAGGTSSTAVAFPANLPSTPVRVFLTPRVSAPGAAVLRMFGTTGITAAGFTCNLNRTDTATTTFDYLAISDMG